MASQLWKTGTVTFCWDFRSETVFPAGTHVNRWGQRIRSARAWWKWFAVAAYHFDDYELVAERHGWEGYDKHDGEVE